MAIRGLAKVEDDDYLTSFSRAAQSALAESQKQGGPRYTNMPVPTGPGDIRAFTASTPGVEGEDLIDDEIDFEGILDENQVQREALEGSFAQEDIRNKTALSDLQKNLLTRYNRNQYDYATTGSRNKFMQDMALKQLQESMAARGTLSSGLYLEGEGEQARKNLEQNQDLQDAYTRATTDIIDELVMGKRNYGLGYQDIASRYLQYKKDQKLAQDKIDADTKLMNELKDARERDLRGINDALNSLGGNTGGGWSGSTGYYVPGLPGPQVRPETQLDLYGLASIAPDQMIRLGSIINPETGQLEGTARINSANDALAWVRNYISPSLNTAEASRIIGALQRPNSPGVRFSELINLITGQPGIVMPY